MGKIVCFDALLHTEHWSELVFLYPKHFEWIKLNKTKTRQYTGYEIDFDSIYKEVQNSIIDFLRQNNSSKNEKLSDNCIENLYTNKISVEELEKILFGEDEKQRLQRRKLLIEHVRNAGFETIPVTEHAPSRPVVFDKIVKTQEGSHTEFKVNNMSSEAKIFGALTPFKLYKTDKDGYPLCKAIQEETWKFIANLYSNFVQEYNFDFMRADMAHNQLSHSHNSDSKVFCNQKEIWKSIKEKIQTIKPYFAVLAEAFLNMDYYIDGYQDLENKKVDIVLGDLNYLFLNHEYIYRLKTRNNNYYNYNFKICSTSFTNDSDRKENIIYYSSPMSCEIRYFTGLFCDSPSYCGIGFELRNFEQEKKETFTSNYTNFQKHPFAWGNNQELFANVLKMRELYSKIGDEIKNKKVFWLNPENDRQACWIYYDEKHEKPLYLFVINLDASCSQKDITITDLYNCVSKNKKYKFKTILSLAVDDNKNKAAFIKDDVLRLNNVSLGECCVYKIETANKICLPTLTNKKRNILLVAPECAPYSKAGGMGDINRDFTEAMVKRYPDIDLRIIIPIYNAENVPPKNFTIENFELEDLKLDCEYSYGLNESYIKLYKIKCPDNNVTTYAAFSPDFSCMKEPYDGTEYDYGKKYIAYSSAVMCILKKLNKHKKEKFKPDVLHLTDWPVGFVNHFLNTKYKDDRFYKNLKTIMTIHNTGYQGKYETFYAFLNLFDKKTINPILNSYNEKLTKETIMNAISNYKEFRAKNHSFCEEISEYIEEHLDTDFFDIDFVTKERFNTLLYSLKHCDAWLTDSESFYKELITNVCYASTLLFETLYRTANKGKGITCGISLDRYMPDDESKIKYPYTLETVFEQKKNNKLYLQECFTKKNIKQNLSNSLFLSKSESKRIFGYLDVNPNAVLIYNTSRFDIGQKGIDCLIKVIKPLLKTNDNLQFVICIKNISKHKKYDYINELLKNVETNKLFKGRVLIVDDFVPVYNYLAAADMLVMPSYFEPCGMVQMQAMRYGTIPVVSNTGGLRYTISESLGFKTEIPLMDVKMPDCFLLDVLSKAISLCKNNPKKWGEHVINCISYDTSWNEEKTSKFYDFYTKVIES